MPISARDEVDPAACTGMSPGSCSLVVQINTADVGAPPADPNPNHADDDGPPPDSPNTADVGAPPADPTDADINDPDANSPPWARQVLSIYDHTCQLLGTTTPADVGGDGAGQYTFTNPKNQYSVTFKSLLISNSVASPSPPQYELGQTGSLQTMKCVNATFCANAIPCGCTDGVKCDGPTMSANAPS